MRFIKYTFLLLAGITALCSCRKYVEITPKGKIIPTEVRDYRLLMNNTTLLLPTMGTNEYGTDDLSFAPSDVYLTVISDVIQRLYNWADFIYADGATDPEWNRMYSQIYVANTVITGAPTATNGSTTDKNQVWGEALVLRANNYLYLVNQYAKMYDPATAATDAGVPLVLQPDLNASLVRVPVKQVYDQIISDLQTAVPLLQDSSVNNKYYASKAAAYSLMARAYLYMGDYTNALTNAQNALAINKTIFDLNTIANNPENTLLNSVNPEIIYWKNAGNAYANMIFSDEFLGIFQTGDLRRKLWMIDANILFPTWAGVTYNGENNYNATTKKVKSMTRNVGPTVPEMMLVQAECLARTGKYNDAINVINALRTKRILAANYSPLTNIPDAQVLSTVLEERRRELFCRGIRWFDLRRLNKEAAFKKTIVHTWSNGTTNSLEPGSNRYLYPIPPVVLALSTEITPNPR